MAEHGHPHEMELDLPTELLVKVLQSLELRELLRCRMVQKRLRSIIDTTPTLQYAIELSVSSYTDNTLSPLPLTSKLALLRKVEAAWKRGRFGLGKGMPYEHDWMYKGNVLYREYEFVMLDVRVAHEGLGLDVEEEGEGEGEKRVGEGEGEERKLEARRWLIDPGLPDYFFLLDSAVDPAQDVAVFLGYDEVVFALSIMRLSTATPLHPQPLRIAPPPHMEDIRAELKSYGHLVAIIFSGVVVNEGGEGEGEGCSMVVSVYDVVRGSLVTNLVNTPEGMGVNARDVFAFVSDSTFVLGAYHGGDYALKVYSIDRAIAGPSLPPTPTPTPLPSAPAPPPTSSTSAALTLPTPTPSLTPVHVATLHFPPVSPGYTSTGWFLDESKSTALDSSEPFQPSPVPPILAVKRVYINPADRDDRLTCVFVVPMAVLEGEVDAYKDSMDTNTEGEGKRTRVVQWTDWGPRKTRCIQAPSDILINPRASLTCHGHRLLVHDPRRTLLLDFNRLDIERDLCRVRGSSSKHTRINGHEKDGDGDVRVTPYPGHLILRPTTIPAGHFLSDVETHLPYRETEVEWVVGAEGKRPFRVIEGNPSLCITGEVGEFPMGLGGGGVKITDYHVLDINAAAA